ncbi:MAG: hypothetical protein OXF27_16315 [Acidobacteria bacterium]|nr:hypothetical protein [Acidobacteriota bacterium]
MPRLIAAAAAILTLIPLAGFAQDLATDILKADIEAVRNSPEGGVDRQISVVDIGKLNVAVGVLHRGPTGDSTGPTTAIEHSQVTEVYYVVSGSGTLITGTAVDDQEQVSADAEIVQVAVGPSSRATFREQGNQVREISEGDVVVIPAGVFHGWRDIADHVTYLSIRPDPDRVLPAGYLNPAVTR